MRPLRILHVTPFCGDAWAYGGIPRVVERLADGLVARGHHVTVCATDACDERARLPSGERELDGVTVRLFPNVSNRAAYRLQLFMPLGMGRWLAEHARSFDVAHLHAYRNLPTSAAARRLRAAGVPYLFSPHGTAPRIERRRAAKWIFDHTLGRGVLEGAHRLIAVSEAERRDLEQLGHDRARIRVLENPVGVHELVPPPPRGLFRARKRLPFSTVLMYVGQLSPRKHVTHLVRAFAQLAPTHRDVGLVIAGPDRGCLSELRALASSLGVDERTRFYGLLAGRERLEALRDADVVAYPGAHEVFGLVLAESLALGTPAVVADDSGAGELITRLGGGLLVRPGDPAALADALRAMLADLDTHRARARAAGDQLAEHYSDAVVVERLEALYAETVGPLRIAA